MRGNNLRSLRESAGLSQEELAKRIGVSEPTIWRVEHDKNVGVDVLEMLADFFGVSTDHLLGRDDKIGELNPLESVALMAWRRGERLEAIKVIAGDE